jgi:DNA-binding CsgD family transcriptional regulator
LVIHGVASSLWAARLLNRAQTLGRSSQCDVRVVHTTVSRQHAQIWRDNGTLFVRDLDSRNGTFVDRVRVTQAPFEIGSTIQLGQVALHVVPSIDDDSTTGDNETELLSKAPDVWARLLEQLSPGQAQVLNLLLRGLGEKEVAERLCLSRHTVHTHVKRIYKKLGVQSRSLLLAEYFGRKQE